MRRNGYFKVDETEAHAAVIFPAGWQHDMSAIDTARQMIAAGITTKLQYVATTRRTIPITELGTN